MKARWLPRVLVGLTTMLCLGTAGYFGPTWWARRVAGKMYSTDLALALSRNAVKGNERAAFQIFLLGWREDPWCGYPAPGIIWYPRRTRYELAKLATGLDLGNDPDAWMAWFKAHPNLIWDYHLKRLVEPPKP